MIITVTLNAAVDRTYRIPAFCTDHIHRPDSCWITAGGKGVNVARAYRTLGGRALATGFIGGQNGRLICDTLDQAGVDRSFIEVAGESRLCITVIDPEAGTQTEINELGPTVSPDECSRLLNHVERLVEEHSPRFLVISGSAPPGVPAEMFSDLVRIANNQRVRSVLDTSGEGLAKGIDARPWMVKPNTLELSALTGCIIESDEQIHHSVIRLLEAGIHVVCVTRGSKGALLVTNGEAWMGSSPAVEVISAVGSGDTFLAGLLTGDVTSWQNRLRLALGAGAANAECYGAATCSRDLMVKRASQAQVEAL